MNNIRRIGVYTSGGDAPGMNAAIRAVVRTALYHNLEVTGIYRGYEGMIEGDFKNLVSRSVSSILQKGGTMLKSARCTEFRIQAVRNKSYDKIKAACTDALVAIVGDGTFTGAETVSNEYHIQVMCIPGTSDNDLYGTDYPLS